MAKKATKSTSKKSAVKNATSMVRIADIVAVVSSVWFMNSVTMNVYDKVSSDLKNAPATYALVLGLAAILYSVTMKRRLSFSIAFSIGLVVASMFIWMLGLSLGLSDLWQ